MEQHVDVDKLTRQTRKLEFEDGLTDFHNAIVFLILGGLASLFMSTAGITLYMRAMLFNQEIATIGLLALIPLLYLVMFGIRRLIGQYRNRVLWRHLGEIEPLKWQVDRKVSIFAAAIWLVIVIVGLFVMGTDRMDLDADMRLFAGASGIATAVVYLAMGQSLGIVRYRWVGIIGGVISAVLLVSPLNVSNSWLIFGILWALTLTVSGFVAYRNTLQRLKERAA